MASHKRRPVPSISTTPPFSNLLANLEHHGRRRDTARPRWPATLGPRGSQLGVQRASPTLPERFTTLVTSRDGRSSRFDGGAPGPQLGHGGRARSGRSSHETAANSPLLRSLTCSCPPKPPRSDPRGREMVAHRSRWTAVLGTERRAKIRRG
jgi:hypothetical protein